jgi:hypothetical protein
MYTYSGEYPVEKSRLVDVAHEYFSHTAGDCHIPEDSNADNRIRLLSLPMLDEAGYDLSKCKHVGVAAQFIERAWRRHKQVLIHNLRRHVNIFI